MSYTVAINGVNSTDFIVLQGTLQCQRNIGKHAQASFTVETTSSIHFAQYQQVSVFDQFGALAFSGYMNDPEETPNGWNDPTGWNGYIRHSISCVDQWFCASKRRVAASYTNRTCGFIVYDIWSNVLSQEGVTIGQIYDGLTPSTTLYPSPTLYPGGNVGLIPQADFNYCKVSEAYDACTKAASDSGVPYYCNIDQNKQLWFVPYTTIVNNNIIDGTTEDNIKVKRGNPLYRNQQIVLGGVAQTVTQNETRQGDTKTVAFPMKFDLAMVPTITVNGTAKTVGINGIDTGKDWYWNKGSNLITQDNSGTKLISTDTLAVTYIGQYPNTTISQNSDQVAYQAALDGTSGIIEDVTNDNSLDSVANALATASAELTRYAQQGAVVTFDTQVSGYDAGQLVTVDLPWHDINMQQMIIESVVASDQRDGVNIWYTVTCIQGPYDVTWQDFFSKLLKTPPSENAINVGSSASVNSVQVFTLTVAHTMNLVISTNTCPLIGSGAIVGTGLIPC